MTAGVDPCQRLLGEVVAILATGLAAKPNLCPLQLASAPKPTLVFLPVW